MKYKHTTVRILVFFLILTMSATQTCAQDRSAMRDSLAAAADLLAYHPDSVDLRLKKAAWNVQLEQWQYALDEYSYILNRHPDNIAARFFRAYVNEQLHRNKFARLDYEAVLMVVPGHFEAMLGLALLNQKEKHYTEAYNQINVLVDLHPDSAVAYAARAGMEYDRQMYDLAEYDYREAMARQPSNTDYAINHIDVLILLRRKGEAREELDRLVAQGLPRQSLRHLYERCK